MPESVPGEFYPVPFQNMDNYFLTMTCGTSQVLFTYSIPSRRSIIFEVFWKYS